VSRGLGAQNAEAARQLGLTDDDLDAWEASGLPARAFDAWLVDRVARRPVGRRAREVYGDDSIHDFARRAILAALEPGPVDHVLDVGCGGGMLLRDVMTAGARATGLDHSDEMVRLARTRVPGATVVRGRAEELPFGGGSFSAVAMSMVLIFLDDPVRALRECRRVLGPSGRLAAYTTSPALRGTAAAPEPIASHAYFYDDAALEGLAREAGLAEVRVTNDDGGQLLTATRMRAAALGQG
jgi:SAM-dependent methyltransferase